MMAETITAYRNHNIREWKFLIADKVLEDLYTGEKTSMALNDLDLFKYELKKQGFKLLPINFQTILWGSREEALSACDNWSIPMFFEPIVA